LLGTFLPFARASESPIAIACVLLFTVLPLPPLLSVPALRRFIAPFTSSEADLEYRAMMFSPLQSRKRQFRRGVFVPRGALALASRPALPKSGMVIRRLRTDGERVFTAAIIVQHHFPLGALDALAGSCCRSPPVAGQKNVGQKQNLLVGQTPPMCDLAPPRLLLYTRERP
jgi:hypothetical protein